LVRREATRVFLQMRNDAAPRVRRGGIGVKEHDRLAGEVSEPAALAARLVCAKHGVMHLEHGFGLPPPAGSIEHAMRELRQRLPDTGWRGIRTEQAPAYLDIVPPGLHAAGPPPNTVHAMRPIDPAGATTQSPPAGLLWLASPGFFAPIMRSVTHPNGSRTHSRRR
jgi:hypothetical protein